MREKEREKERERDSHSETSSQDLLRKVFARYFEIVSPSSLWKRPTVQLHRRRIVHQSSQEVCLSRHNIVVFPLRPPPVSSAFPFPDKEKNRPRSAAVNQCAILCFLSLSIHLSVSRSFFLSLSNSCFFTLPPPPNFLSVLSWLPRSRPFLSFLFPSSRLALSILFSFHLCASAIITGEPTVQIFNLVWQMADLETRYVCQTGQKKKSFDVCP